MADKTIPEFTEYLRGLKPAWEAMRTNPHLVFEAELEWALQAFTKNKYATDYTLGNTEAATNAFRNIAAIGITLDPARKFAYILPRDNKMVFDLSYQGLMEIAISSGSIQWGQARRVHEHDVFVMGGYDEPPKHQFKPFAKPEERGPVIGAYVVVKTAGGDYLTSTMAIDEIHAIRARSSSWKAYLASKDGPNPKTCPWNTDAKKMELKTVVKDAYPYWPRSERLDKAIHYLNTDGGQGIDLPGQPDTTAVTLLEGLLSRLKRCGAGNEVAALWAEGRVTLKEYPDETATLRTAVAARNHELGVQPPAKNGAAPGAASTAGASTGAAPKPGSWADIMGKINAAEDDAALEATGPMIDALCAETKDDKQLGELNTAFNKRGQYLDRKAGREVREA